MAFSPNDYQGCKVVSQAVVGSAVDVTTDTHVCVDAISATNLNAAVAYIQIFDKQKASVSLGTTAPDWYIALPASGNVFIQLPKPVNHHTGCSIACTTSATGSTAGSASVTVFYGSLA